MTAMTQGPSIPRAEEPAAGLDLCAGAALAERGRAHVWDIALRGEAATAFALRIDGRVVAYVNRCVHVDAEMDWNPGEFLDREGRTIHVDWAADY